MLDIEIWMGMRYHEISREDIKNHEYPHGYRISSSSSFTALKDLQTSPIYSSQLKRHFCLTFDLVPTTSDLISVPW
jgi:hypothetical protein